VVWGRLSAPRREDDRGSASRSRTVETAPAVAQDVAVAPLEQSLRAALVESRSRYKDLVELSSDFAFETDAHGRFVFVSPKGALGYSADELVGRHGSELIFAQDEIADPSSLFASQHDVVDGEVWVRTKAGVPALLIVTALPIVGVLGVFNGARGVARDASQAYAQTKALARADLRERLIFRILRAAETEADPARAIDAVATAIASATGSTCRIFAHDGSGAPFAGAGPGPDFVGIASAAVGAPTATYVDGGQALLIPARHLGRDIGTLVLWRTMAKGEFPADERDLAVALAGHIGLLLAQVDAQNELARLARTDPLTGLLNRRAFVEEIERRLFRIRTGQGHGVLVLIDLDNFKPVNDRLGHAAGDQALIAVARHLLAAVRGPDLVARLGGDEFALWLDAIDIDVAEARLAIIGGGVAALVPASMEAGLPLGLSAGLAPMESGVTLTFAELMHRADTAVYASKAAGKGRATRWSDPA
jgi:diguanylate cyclase (GGDEF)-like protein/PAS domain S-box-containing protein